MLFQNKHISSSSLFSFPCSTLSPTTASVLNTCCGPKPDPDLARIHNMISKTGPRILSNRKPLKCRSLRSFSVTYGRPNESAPISSPALLRNLCGSATLSNHIPKLEATCSYHQDYEHCCSQPTRDSPSFSVLFYSVRFLEPTIQARSLQLEPSIVVNTHHTDYFPQALIGAGD